MIDDTTEQGRVIAAAMRLAAQRPWAEVTLLDIAEASGLGLADLRRHASSKSEILVAFVRTTDDEMLRRIPARADGQSVRDTLFEVVMSRLDVMQPYRAALRSIIRSGGFEPALVRSFVATQNWMLQAAGINTDGLAGGVRLAGLGSVYAAVLQIWLDDEDPGFARTMAALDRRLRSGERTLRVVDGALGAVGRLAEAISPLHRRASPRNPASADARDGDGTPPSSVTP